MDLAFRETNLGLEILVNIEMQALEQADADLNLGDVTHAELTDLLQTLIDLALQRDAIEVKIVPRTVGFDPRGVSTRADLVIRFRPFRGVLRSFGDFMVGSGPAASQFEHEIVAGADREDLGKIVLFSLLATALDCD